MLRRLAAVIAPAAFFGTMLAPQAEALSAFRVCVTTNSEYTFSNGLTLTAVPPDTTASVGWDAPTCVAVTTGGAISTPVFDDNVRVGNYAGTCLLGFFTGYGGSEGFNGTLIGSSVYVIQSTGSNFQYVMVLTALPRNGSPTGSIALPCTGNTAAGSIPGTPSGVQVVVVD